MQLHAKRSGSGPDLIILHGLFGSSENLGRVGSLLSPNFRIHALDLRNHGRSFHSERMDYSSMASDVVRYMDEQSIGSAFMLGHSMGGKVAMTLAQQHPEKVSALIVADIAPSAYPPRHDSILDALQSLSLDRIESRDQAAEHLRTHHVEDEIIPFLLKNLVREDGRYRWRINLKSIVANYGGIMSETTFRIAFAKPVLFLIGEQSDYVKPAHGPLIRKLFPNATAKVISGTSHWLHAQKPETFALLCRKFLDTVQSSDAD